MSERHRIMLGAMCGLGFGTMMTLVDSVYEGQCRIIMPTGSAVLAGACLALCAVAFVGLIRSAAPSTKGEG